MTLQDWHDGFKAIRRLKLPIKPGRYRTRGGRIAVVLDTNYYLSNGYLEARGNAKQRACSWFTKDGEWPGANKCWNLVERLAR